MEVGTRRGVARRRNEVRTDAVELVEAAPGAGLREAREELAHHLHVHTSTQRSPVSSVRTCEKTLYHFG